MDFTHLNAGMVTRWLAEEQLLEFEVKNQIRVGDQLEVISPAGLTTITVQSILNSHRKAVDVIHGGTGLAYIPFASDPGDYTMLRKIL